MNSVCRPRRPKTRSRWRQFSHFCSCVCVVGQTERRDSTLPTLYIHSIFSSSAAFQHWSSTASLCTSLLKYDLTTAALTVYSQLTNVPIIPHLAFTIFHSTTRSCCLLLSRILIGFCFMHKVFFSLLEVTWRSFRVQAADCGVTISDTQ